ncbi:Lrp/AsnC family transcriptional regulator [Nitratireductor sp. XY-223]|uniref:Lrp/AsnC family transcriptional regulator n=1 Tax=Nitratireductor sp. XY-223 TaxID=2561926 RepID=UPI0010AA0702|nr:Lrp/AsnC family transcriptional regulator [Nitratireductor sp. XY-223]
MNTVKLDARDIKILAALSREGRMSKAALAQKVNLSATPCWERLNRLEKAGVISGYGAKIELKRIASHVSVFVMAELENHRAETFQTFERAVARHDEITSCWAIGGGYDYLLQVITRDIDTYQRLIDTLLESGTGLARYFSYIVTKPVKASPMPPFDILLPTLAEKD